MRGYGRRPGRLFRALATVPLAAAHARDLRRLEIAHVHAHWANFPAMTAWLCRRLVGVPYSFTAHAHDIFIDQSFLERLVRDAAFVVTVADYHRAFLRPYGGDRTPVHVVRYGIEIERYAFRPREAPPAGPLRALCVASFQEYKGHEHLLRALALGGPALDRIELDLVGRGPLQPELEALAARLGLSDRIRFLGTVPEEEVTALLQRCDLAVLPSVVARTGEQEGLPNFLLEALASGAPAVGTAVSGIPELLREDATCLLAMPADPASLAAALDHVVTHPAAARRRSEAGRRLVESDYTVERAAELLDALFTGRATMRADLTPSSSGE